jgi:hypothetical protein
MSEPTNTETPQVPETAASEDTVSFYPTYTNTYVVPLYFNSMSMIDIYCSPSHNQIYPPFSIT